MKLEWHSYRVDGWQDEIDRKDHDDIDDEHNGARGRSMPEVSLCSGNGFIGHVERPAATEYSTGLRFREFTIGFFARQRKHIYKKKKKQPLSKSVFGNSALVTG